MKVCQPNFNHARLLILVLGMLCGTHLLYAQSNTPSRQTWMTNGPVDAIAHTADRIYIGGSFSYIGPNTGSGVPIDAKTGANLPLFPKVKGIVYACIPDGVGGWYIGGEFTQVDGIERNGLAHITRDYALDTIWNPNPTDSYSPEILALALSGSTLYAGGAFTGIGGKPRNCMAALDVSTGLATDWDPKSNSAIYALVISGSKIYAGGYFSSIGGKNRNRIAALDLAAGNATDWDPGSTGSVYALAISGSTLYAGGSFSNIGGAPRNYIAALDTSTGLATAWNPNGTNSWYMSRINKIDVAGSRVYIGGEFTKLGSLQRNGLASVDTSTGLPTEWNPFPQAQGYANPSIRALCISGSTAYVGGYFTSMGVQWRNNVAAIDTSTGLPTAWNPNANGRADLDNTDYPVDRSVYALAVSDSTVYVGGAFSSIGGKTRKSLAALDAVTGQVTNWNPSALYSSYDMAIVRDLVISGSIVYAAGDFTAIGGQNRTTIAALDTVTGLATAWAPKINGPLINMALSNNGLYVGGMFSKVGNDARNAIAEIDTSTGLATSWNPNASLSNGYSPWVGAFAVQGSIVYAGGSFDTIGTKARSGLAALDASTGVATDWNPNVGSAYASDYYHPSVCALAATDAVVYAGGDFTSVGLKSRSAIAAIDVSSGEATDWNPASDGVVLALGLKDSTVFAGGYFWQIGGQSRIKAAGIDAFTALATSWDPDITARYTSSRPYVYAIEPIGTSVYVGGGFDTTDGYNGFARYDRQSNVKVWDQYE